MSEFLKIYNNLSIIATLTVSSSSLLLTVNAQSSCPSGPLTGIMLCPPPRPAPYQLLVKSWNAEIDGVSAILNITSVDSAGKVIGTLFGGSLYVQKIYNVKSLDLFTQNLVDLAFSIPLLL